ncbi:hypothetical protein D3C80_2171270 [compost metagenome]
MVDATEGLEQRVALLDHHALDVMPVAIAGRIGNLGVCGQRRGSGQHGQQGKQ